MAGTSKPGYWEPANIEGRFWSKVEKTSDCWLWTGRTTNGYGMFDYAYDRQMRAHRWLYQLVNGPVAKELHTDHLCRNKRCVRPDHLEAVTARTNILRGTSFAARNAAKTECLNGHPFDEDNILRPAANRSHRACRACRCEYMRRYRATHKKSA